MLRGLRWQLIAFIMAVLLFSAALSTRLSVETAEPETPAQPAPTQTSQPVPTLTPNPGVLVQPEAPSAEIVTFREGLIGAVRQLNPLLVGDNAAERDIASLIFEGLTRTNQYGEPQPNLAREWIISSDGLEYIVRLRNDVLWQDGMPFTAADVVYTMSVLRSPDFPGPQALGTFWRTVETEQLEPDLVRFRLTQPLGSFLDKLRIGILPEHALAGTPTSQIASHPFNLSPIGTGPYQLEALHVESGNTITQVDLRAAPVYRQRPEGQVGYAVDRISFQLYGSFDDGLVALRSGELDGMAARSHRDRRPLLGAATEAGFNVHTTLDSTLGIVIFNWQREETRYFREQRVRLALETGIDRSPIVQRNLMNIAVQANSPLWPGSWAYEADLQWPETDTNTARFLLETSNVSRLRESENGEDAAEPEQAEGEVTEEATEEPTVSPYLLSFSILAPDDPALVNMLREMSVQWSLLNVNVTIDAQPPDAYQARLESGDFEAALVELSLGDSADPDVYPFWHEGQYPDGLNYGGVSDRRISELLEKARREPGGLNRDIHYSQFQRDFVERAIAIPMYYPLYTYVTSADFEGVQLGFVGSPADRFMTIGEWTAH